MEIYHYKIVHLTGVLMIFLSFGGLICRSILGEKGKKLKKLAGLTNGIGLLLTLVGGFGLLAKLNLGFPGWIIAKLLIWIIFGGLIAVINRKPELGRVLWWLVILLGMTSVYLVEVRPF